MGRVSWCAACRPTGVRCERCEAQRLHQNAARMKNYQKTKQDPALYETHLNRSMDGMAALKVERWAVGLTANGKRRNGPLSDQQRDDVFEMLETMSMNPIPRCEKCPPVGRPCKACRYAHGQARHKERMATDPEYHAAVLAKGRAYKARAKAREKGEDVPARANGRPQKKPRCAECGPLAQPCKPCRNAYDRANYAKRMQDEATRAQAQAKLARMYERRKAASLEARIAKASSPAAIAEREQRERARAERQAQAAAERAARVRRPNPAHERTRPRCEDCPPKGDPCRDCYNKRKRQLKGGDGEYQTVVRPSLALKAPPIPARHAAEVMTAVIPQAPAPRQRGDHNYDLDTCSVCMRRGRWGGRRACDRHAEQVGAPADLSVRHVRQSYVADAKAGQRA